MQSNLFAFLWFLGPTLTQLCIKYLVGNWEGCGGLFPLKPCQSRRRNVNSIFVSWGSGSFKNLRKPLTHVRVKNFPTLNYVNVLVHSKQNKAAAAHVMGKCIIAFEFHCWNFSRGPGSSVTSRLPHNLTAVRQVMVSGRSRFTASTVSVTVVEL